MRTTRAKDELEATAYPALPKGVLDLLEQAGSRRSVEPGEKLFEVGQSSYDFHYVIEGQVDVVDRAGDRQIIRVEPGNFLGELGMLMGQSAFFDAVVVEPGRVLTVPLAELRELVAQVPELGDLVVGAFAARRKLLLQWHEGGFVLCGDEDDKGLIRLQEFAERSRIPHRLVHRSQAAQMQSLAEICEIPESGTFAVIGQSQVLTNPKPIDVARALGLDLEPDCKQLFDVVVIGAGPAGLASLVYAASEGLCAAAIEDTAIGGQAGTSSRIENYLGFPRGIAGAELAFLGEIQAVKFGGRILSPRRATRLEGKAGAFRVGLDDGAEIKTKSVILANGVQYRRLPLERLEEFEGSGVYYAATDLEARFCRNSEVVIVGGGNSAGQAAMFLSRYAEKTHVVVRGEGLAATMSKYLTERIEHDDRIQLWTRTQVNGLDGPTGERAHLEQVTLRNRDSGDEQQIHCRALFIMIGAAPNTDWLAPLVQLDERGFVQTGAAAGPGLEGYSTSCPGVFAVGDLRSGSVKRVASAVGEGSVVVSAVHAFLRDLEREA